MRIIKYLIIDLDDYMTFKSRLNHGTTLVILLDVKVINALAIMSEFTACSF